jgi:F0F1-type ATP synthase assembly protein I
VQRLSPAVQLIGLGSYVATCIAGATVGGYFLDRAWDTAPILTLIGLALGLVAAFYGGYRMLMETIADANRWQRTQGKAPPRDDTKR